VCVSGFDPRSRRGPSGRDALRRPDAITASTRSEWIPEPRSPDLRAWNRRKNYGRFGQIAQFREPNASRSTPRQSPGQGARTNIRHPQDSAAGGEARVRTRRRLDDRGSEDSRVLRESTSASPPTTAKRCRGVTAGRASRVSETAATERGQRRGDGARRWPRSVRLSGNGLRKRRRTRRQSAAGRRRRAPPLLIPTRRVTQAARGALRTMQGALPCSNAGQPTSRVEHLSATAILVANRRPRHAGARSARLAARPRRGIRRTRNALICCT
jgi:hypothetical protein